MGYGDRYLQVFYELNYNWLVEYDLLEACDSLILSDPSGYIIETGGYILLALVNEEIVGSIAFCKRSETTLELMKFCIAPQHRSNGYGRQLLSAGLSKAKENDIMRVTLQSNSKLQAAIEMYQRFGFAFTSVEDRGYQSADVQMEIILKAH